MNKFIKVFFIFSVSAVLSFLSFTAEDIRADLATLDLRYNAAENFSETGSDFWNYYYANNDEEGKMGKLYPHGAGLFDNYYADGTLGKEYQYVVGSSDFISNEYHQYLSIWGGVLLHPGGNADAVISFVAPVDGTVNVYATIKAMEPSSDGVKIYATLNNTDNSVLPGGQEFILHDSVSDYDLRIENLSLKRGDELFFRVNKNETLAFDATYLSPTVEYADYTLPSDIALELSSENLTVEKGGIRLLDAKINVNLGQRLNYVFASSDESVVIVKNNGLVYAVGEGAAEVYVTENESGLSGKCIVTVTGENGGVKDKKHGCKGAVLPIPGVMFALCAAFIIKNKIKLLQG